MTTARWKASKSPSHSVSHAIERRAFRLANFRPRQFWLGTLAWIVFFAFPLLPGWLMRNAYDQIKGSGLSKTFLLFSFGALLSEVVMAVILYFGHSTYMRGFEAGETLVRANLLHAQLANGGTEQGPRALSAGDAVARFRDDPHDLIMLVDNWVDVVGSFGYAIVAVTILSTIDPLAAIVAVAPLILVGIANNRIGNRIRKLRATARAATSDATDFLAAAFGASLTVKVSGASDGVLARVDELNGVRSRAMVRDQTWSDALWSVNGAAVDVCIGLALVVASRRALTPGDIALFASYSLHLSWLPQKLGGVIVGRKRFEVSAGRLDAMLPPSASTDDAKEKRPDPLTFARDFPVLGGPPSPAIRRPKRVPLHSLEVRGLTVKQRNLQNVSFTIERSSLTVVSGQVGAGKTSLLRALLGLLPLDDGDIFWNAERVVDPAAFFIPPQCAYVAQVPQLFSETLLDNLLLGADDDPTDAIHLAAFDEDVAQFAEGLHTLVGAGGVRLSGGQAQRAAAARALVHRTEIIVFDDLTSALDVETELLLWDRLAANNATVLAVSNRPVARSRADQIIEL
jgi:ATP-binding cassette, subfamily B, bacterial